MAPLIILLVTFCIALITIRVAKKEINYSLAGRIAMAAMMIFTGISHFIFTKGMTMMLPGFFPMKTGIIYLTGIIEIMAGIGLLIKKTARLAGILLILFFIFILPSNVIATINKVNVEKGTSDGPGVSYLWFRVPLQIFFIVWTYLCAVRKRARGSQSTLV